MWKGWIASLLLLLGVVAAHGNLFFHPGAVNSTPPSVPLANPIVIVTSENTGLAEVALPGNTLMPYTASLIANGGALLTNYYTEMHPSFPGYNWYLSGGNNSVTTDTCYLPTITDNIFRHLLTAGKTWRYYVEGLTVNGLNAQTYLNCTNQFGGYVDTGWAIQFCDVINAGQSGCSGIAGQTNAQQNVEIVDFSQFASDVANNTLANINFVVPTLLNDMDSKTDGNTFPQTVTLADTWIQNNVAALFSTAAFQPGGTGIYFEIWDEGCDEICGTYRGGDDDSCSSTVLTGCGGNAPVVVVSPLVKSNYQDANYYLQPTVLRTWMELLGLPNQNTYPQAAASAPDMAEIFKTP
jgi:phosphatidylinositol-3-phosphatase